MRLPFMHIPRTVFDVVEHVVFQPVFDPFMSRRRPWVRLTFIATQLCT